MSYAREDRGHLGLSDQQLEDEFRAQEMVVREIVDGLYRNYRSRSMAVTLLKRARAMTGVYSFRDLISALSDDDVTVPEALEMYAPNIADWNERIREARRE